MDTTVSDLNVSLLPWQREVWKSEARFKVIAAGRRCGKTQFVAWELIIKALQADKGHVFYIAATLGQARDVIWATLIELCQPVLKNAHINNLQITLINGSTITLKGSDRPDTMRGVSLYHAALDEYASMKPFVWEEVIRPALADQKGTATFIGTPSGRNHFYDIYEYAKLGDDPTWAAWHFTSFDNPILDPEEINAAKRSMSSYAFRKEFMASFEAQDSELFKEEWLKFSENEPEQGDYYIAVDPAGFAEVGGRTTKSRLDQTAIAIVKVNEDGWYVKDIIHGRWDLMETTARIFKAVEEYKPIAVGIEKGIAQQAVMSPLTEMMKQRGRFFRVDLLSHGNQKKTDRIVWALQGIMEHGRVTLNKGDWNTIFLDQLFQFPSKLTHDDLIDALSYIEQLAIVPYTNSIDSLDEWDPLDAIAGY